MPANRTCTSPSKRGLPAANVSSEKRHDHRKNNGQLGRELHPKPCCAARLPTAVPGSLRIRSSSRSVTCLPEIFPAPDWAARYDLKHSRQMRCGARMSPPQAAMEGSMSSRNVVERFFNRIKHFRRVSTRDGKVADTSLTPTSCSRRLPVRLGHS